MNEYLPKNWKQILGWLIVMGATALASVLGYGVFNPAPPPLPIWQEPDGTTVKAAFGWADRPADVKAIQATLKYPIFGDTEAGKAADPLPDHVYLWQVYKTVDARGPPCKNQNPIGSCVSFGTNNGILRTMAAQIVIGKQNAELKDIAEEVTYAGSRVEIGGGRLGNGDGSVGAWAAQFVQKWGVVARAKHGDFDLTTYDPNRCRSWGKTGVPDQLEQIAREHPVKTTTQVQNWSEAKRALANGYGIAVCSSQGFSMQRDARGIARAQGSWAHCMCLDGYHVEGGQEYGHIENSWGPNAHTGPVGWGEPSTAGFWAEASVIDRMLKANDSWAFSAVQGFPARKLDWFVQWQREEMNRALFAQFSKGVSVHAIRN